MNAVGAVKGDDVGSGGSEGDCVGKGGSDAELAAAVALLDADNRKLRVKADCTDVFGGIETKTLRSAQYHRACDATQGGGIFHRVVGRRLAGDY